MLAAASPAFADGHGGSTLRVVAVETDNVKAYADEIGNGRKIMEGINSKMTLRAWQATFAGGNTGNVVVALEYPGSLAEFAVAWEQLLADEKMAKWLSGLSGLRTIVSDSLYTEIAL